MPRTEASNRAQYKYNAKNIKRIPLDVQKTYFEEVLKPAADARGMSINGFIKLAIQNEIDRGLSNTKI